MKRNKLLRFKCAHKSHNKRFIHRKPWLTVEQLDSRHSLMNTNNPQLNGVTHCSVCFLPLTIQIKIVKHSHIHHSYPIKSTHFFPSREYVSACVRDNS